MLPPIICECGEWYGLYYSERLERHVCPKCLESEVKRLKALIERYRRWTAHNPMDEAAGED